MSTVVFILNLLTFCLGATDFCSEPLGMARRIILDQQITESTVYYDKTDYKGFNARLNSTKRWCASIGSTLDQQWVKVDLRYPMSIRGVSIQGDPGWPANYIKKFKLRYSVDGTNFLYKTTATNGNAEELIGATGQSQTIDRMFLTKPFAARYVEFRPIEKAGADACVRFELYGCSYVCNEGLGIEHGTALPSGFVMTSSSNQNGKDASSARLNSASSSWCASSNDANQYLQIDFGKTLTMTGIAVQGNPTANSWVKDFYFDYGMDINSLVTYQENGNNKLFVGNVDRNTKVVNWFNVRLFARSIKIKPNSWDGDICMRIEMIGCHAGSVYELGAENRALEDSKFSASGHMTWLTGRYVPHDGRLNNDRPWAEGKVSSNPWFKVDLGRVMLVNGISIQGDATWGPNYYPDYKIQYSFDANVAVGALIGMKEELTSSDKIFTGNTNNAGVKFNLIVNPISTRHVRFMKNSNLLHDYALRVEIYGQPQACIKSFGMEAGSPSKYNPTVQASSGSIPADKAKLNSPTAWCATTTDSNQYFEHDFGAIRTISGFAIQGHPVDEKWVTTFNVDYKEQQSQPFTTYQESGSNKAFVGCKNQSLIVYHWFATNLRMRYLRIRPLTWNAEICLRLNVYGCPSDDCFSEIGLSSNAIADALFSSSTHVSSREAHKGRLNMESVWEACQFGSCTPQESSGNNPWIQVCLSSVQRITSIIVQGPGNFDNIAKVTEFSLKFGTSSSGPFENYNIDGSLKKFTVSGGRYTSSQIDLPFAIVAKCIRLQVESQSPTNQNSGLRWELLGCTTIPQVSSVSITPSNPSVAKGGVVTSSCNAIALPGAQMVWKKGIVALTTKDVYEVGAVTFSNDNNNNYKVAMTLKITASAAYAVSSFQTCAVTNNVQGLVECKQTYECSASNGGIISSLRSTTTEVTITGLQAKAPKVSGITHSSVTNKSFSLNWNAATPADFPIKDYKAVLKKKADGSVVKTESNLASTSTTFHGLEPFTEYIVEISAQSSLAVFSDAATHEVKTDEGVSAPPTSISATAVSSSHVLLTWGQPAFFNGILHDYKIRYKVTADSAYGSSFSAGAKLNYTISGLRPFTRYNLQVHATTKGGAILGPWASAADTTTFEGFPSQPQDLSTVERAARSVKIKWTKPKAENGIVRNYTIVFNGVKSYNNSFTQQDSMTVMQNLSSSSTNSFLGGLVPGTDYSIVIAATTGGGTGNFSTPLKVKTLFEDPPKPLLQDQGVTNGIKKLLLDQTSNINGPISEYQISIAVGEMTNCSQSDPKDKIDPSRIPLTLEVTKGVKKINGTSLEIGTIGNYTLCYTAAIKDQSQTFISEVALVTIERKHLEKLDPGTYKSETTENSVVIPLAQGPAATKSYHVIVMEGNTSSKTPDEWLPSELGPYDASTYQAGKLYVTAVLSSYVSKFSVGDGKEYPLSNRRRRNVANVVYKNVPLKENTEYLIFQRAYISQSVYYSSVWMGPLATKKSSGGPTTTPDPETDIIRIIVGIVVPVVMVAIIANVLILMNRRRKARAKSDDIATKKPVMMEPIPQSSNNPSFNDDEDEATNVEDTLPVVKPGSQLERRRSSASSLRRKKAPRSIKHDSHHPPISVEDFARQCKELHRDSHHGITLEYEDLGKGQQYSWDVAVNPTNKPKNRYANIAAYDHSRVKLNPIPGKPYSDYFNANFISGYLRDSVYIASQGPIDSVLGDFWRMVWDKNVPVIVMLTNLTERAKKKCSQYWPDLGSAEFGKITVTSESVESYVDYTIRCFSVSQASLNESRKVYQFHYTTWPDHGIPETPTDLLNLQRKLRKAFPFSIQSPIIVHCSAGVGRTGTFIVIDAMLELLQSQRKIDVFNYLNFIRTQRIHMVQVEEQYLFIYKALLESVTCGMTEIETQNLRIKINQLSAKEKSNQTGFDKQFQRLLLVTPHFNEKETTGLSKSNLSRNRKPNIVPRDINRVILQQSIYENDGSTDYINATYVSGYKRKNAYIATQHPLPNTINDFWSMIYQSNVTTFVLLNKIQTKPENLPVFWPESEQEIVYGNIVVRKEQEQDTFESTERNFVISHRDSRGNERFVKMLHFENWPDHSVPRDCDNLLKLIYKVEKCQQQQSEDQPIVIMCSDGAGRTGTFIAITIILERFKTEQLIDVFQTIKKLRAFRPEFVENSVQYKFCHTIVQDYMASFDDYANFTG